MPGCKCCKCKGNIVTRFLRSITGCNSEKSLEDKVEAYSRYMKLNTQTIKNLLEDIDALTDGVLKMQERIRVLELKQNARP